MDGTNSLKRVSTQTVKDLQFRRESRPQNRSN